MIQYRAIRNKIKLTFGGENMAKVCYVCGKGVTTGNQVSHSKKASRRTWGANLQKKSIEVDGKPTQEYICTRCLKTMKKGN